MTFQTLADPTPEDRRRLRAWGSLGGLTYAANNDVHVSAAKARAAQAARYLNGHSCDLCPETVIPADLPLVERQRRVTALRKVHMKRLALKRHGL
jgi:hypothetical protein